ncbi:MAG: DUF2155 domain-containing protein [Bdellovibrionales bacterium]
MLLVFGLTQHAFARASIETSIAKLRSIDKVTARTLTFEVDVGTTVKFGSIYIKLQACRKAPDIEEPENAAFMQIWEVSDEDTEREKANWVYSGWMFASSPGLSAMDHPIYDVWVLECKDKQQESPAIIEGEVLEGEGVVDDQEAPSQPSITE